MDHESGRFGTGLGGSSRALIAAPPRRCARLLSRVAIASLLVSTSVTAQEAGSPDARTDGRPAGSDANDADYETLRKLLGLPTRTREAAPAVAVPVEAEPVMAPPPEELEPALRETVPQRSKPPMTRPAPARKTTKSPTAPTPLAPAAPERLEEVRAPDPVPAVEMPPAGTIVSSTNLERWKHLLGPSIQWAVAHGATLDVIPAQPAPIEPRRQQATERYSAQVKLAADKRSMVNYVAGIPFPHASTDDPDMAIKTVFNFEARTAVDDLDLRKSSCDTAELTDTGVRVEKHYLSDHLRRLFYVGRLHHEPMPTWATLEGFRYREMVAGLIEPFDLKGAGYTYARYLDPSRQDDSWVYYPSSRRVRRLSTAQRSEGVFGTDIDLDSFAGYSGNPAWTEWEYLGTKPVLGSLHARNHPVRFEAAPADFFPDDVWEVRDVHIIVGTPVTGGGAFSRRVLYIDKESLLVPYAEIYDLNGSLWKGLVFTWRNDKKASPTATQAVYDEAMAFHANFSIYDMQLDHTTRCESPAHEFPQEEGWFYNFGEAESVTESVFTVAGVIGEAR